MLSKSYNPSGILLQFVQYQKIRKDNRISVSKYRNISIPTLYLDYIKKLSLYLFYTDENSGVTYGNEISKHAPTFHMQNRYGPPQTTRSDICESLFELLPISSEKEKLLYFDRLRDLDTKTLTIQIFLHRLLSYVQSPKSK